MRKILWFGETIGLRVALLLALGLLLGCETSKFDAATPLDSDVIVYRGPVIWDAGVAIDLESRGADAGVNVISHEVAADVLPVSLDTHPSVEVATGHCLQGAIANGYSSANGSCENPPKGIGIDTTQFATPEEACRFAIDCYANNDCNVYNSTSAACSPCFFRPWTHGSTTPWDWMSVIILPYCPNFFPRP